MSSETSSFARTPGNAMLTWRNCTAMSFKSGSPFLPAAAGMIIVQRRGAAPRRRLSKNLPSRKFRREEKCERKPSGFPFAFNHPPQRQNCKIMLQKLILQFWKQLVKKVQRDFFDKQRRGAAPRRELIFRLYCRGGASPSRTILHQRVVSTVISPETIFFDSSSTAFFTSSGTCCAAPSSP